MAENSHPIAERIYALLGTILEDGTMIPKMYHPIIENLIKTYLKKATEKQLQTVIENLRDKLIPSILTGEGMDDNGKS